MHPWIVQFDSLLQDGYNGAINRDFYSESSPVCKLYGYFAISRATIDRDGIKAEIKGETVWLDDPITKDYEFIFNYLEPPETLTQSTISFVNTLSETSLSLGIYDFDGDYKDSLTKDFSDIAAGFFVGGDEPTADDSAELFYENDIDQRVISKQFSLALSSDDWDTQNNYSLDSAYADTYMNVVAPSISEYNYFYHLDIPDTLSQVVDGDGKLWYPLLPSRLLTEPAMIPHYELYKPDGNTLVLTHSFMQPFTPVGSNPYSSGSGGGGYIKLYVSGVGEGCFSLLFYDNEESGVYSGKLEIDVEAELSNATFVVRYGDADYEPQILLSTTAGFSRKTVDFDIPYATAIVISLEGNTGDTGEALVYSVKFAGTTFSGQDFVDYNHNWYVGFNYDDEPIVVEAGETLDKMELSFSSIDWPENRIGRFRIRPRDSDKILVATDDISGILSERAEFDSDSAMFSSSQDGVVAPDWLDGSGYGYLGFGNTNSRLFKSYSYSDGYIYRGRLLRADQVLGVWSVEKDGSTVTPTAISTSGDKFYLEPFMVEKEKVFDSVVDNSRTTGDIEYHVGINTYKAASAAFYKQVYDEETEEWSWDNYRNDNLTDSDYSDHPYVLLSFSESDYYEKDGDYYRAKVVFSIKRLEGDGFHKAIVFRCGSFYDLLYKHGEEQAAKYGVESSFSSIVGDGTVSRESGSGNNITGDGTSFLSDFQAGDVMYVDGFSSIPPGVVLRVISNTEMYVNGYDEIDEKEYRFYPREYRLLETIQSPNNVLWPVPETTSTTVDYPSENDFIDSVREGNESWAANEVYGYASVEKVFGSLLESFDDLPIFESNADYRICKFYIVPIKYTGLIIDVLDDGDNVVESIDFEAASGIDISSVAREYSGLCGNKYAFVDIDDLKILEIQITAPIMKLGKLLLDDQLNARIINPAKIGTYRVISSE